VSAGTAKWYLLDFVRDSARTWMIVAVVGGCVFGGLFVLRTALLDYTLQACIGSIRHTYLLASMVNFSLKFWIHSIFVFVLQCVIHRCGIPVCVVVHFSFIKLCFFFIAWYEVAVLMC
jgi:hypothetical protein